MICDYGYVECPYWQPSDYCLSPDQSADYCPCFNEELQYFDSLISVVRSHRTPWDK